jgi:hypothetical protein
LVQFGFHTYESEYNIDEHSYFIQQIKDGEDGQVAGLYGYLRGEKVQTDPADAPWSGQPLRLFLSHIHQERVFAGNLKEALAGYASTASSHTTTSSRASGGVM